MPSSTDPLLLRVRNLSKSFAAPVLRQFNFELMRGEVHALVGSNGAGKSTFARILAGLLEPDSGEMLLDGSAFAPDSRADARSTGVVLMLQELNLLPTLSIAENLFFHRLPSLCGFVRKPRLLAQARRALARVGLESVDPALPAGSLGIGLQQLVELAAALAEDCQLLILDEPTAALSHRETATLFENIQRLKAGGTSVLYISHRLDELRAIADRVTVLRDGQTVTTIPAAGISTRELIPLMSGRSFDLRPSRRRAPGPVCLRVSNLRGPGVLKDVSFQLRQDEILGLFGLVGAGRTETLRALCGADPFESGTIEIGHPLRPVRFKSPAQSARAGVAFVPEDRRDQGLLLPLSVRTNLTLSSLRRYACGPFIRPGAEQTAAVAAAEPLRIQCACLDQPVAELSGGNQQKTVISRWLLTDASIFLLDEPARGVDAASKEAIHSLLRELASSGKAVLVVSSELEELMLLCDRIAVISNGSTVGEFQPHEWSSEKLLQAAFQGYASPELRNPPPVRSAA